MIILRSISSCHEASGDLWRTGGHLLCTNTIRRLGSIFVFITLFAAAYTHAAEKNGVEGNLTLLLTQQPPLPGRISTATQAPSQFTVQTGHTVHYAYESGIEVQLQGGGLYGVQLQERPTNQRVIAITPTMLENGLVDLEIATLEKQGSSNQQISSTIIIEPGLWQQIYGTSVSAGGMDQRTTYSTRRGAQESLYIKVLEP